MPKKWPVLTSGLKTCCAICFLSCEFFFGAESVRLIIILSGFGKGSALSPVARLKSRGAARQSARIAIILSGFTL